MMIAKDFEISFHNGMNVTDIKKLVHDAKQIQGSANALVIGDMLERLIHAIEELMIKAANQEAELAKHRTTVFGAKSEKLAHADQFASESQTPTPANDDEVDPATEAASASTDMHQTVEQIKELKAEARRLALEAGLHNSKKKVKLTSITSSSRGTTQEIVRHPIPDDLSVVCPLCKEQVKDRGKSYESQEIDVVASNYMVRTNIMHKASCLCESLQFCMPSPVKGVLGSRFSPRFVAKVLYDKFVMHLPVYRQVKAMIDKTKVINSQLIIFAGRFLLVRLPVVAILRHMELQKVCFKMWTPLLLKNQTSI